MRRSFHLAVAVAAAAGFLLFERAAHAKDSDDEYLWRNHSGFVGIEPYMDNVSASAPVVPATPQPGPRSSSTAAPVTLATPEQTSFSTLRAQVAAHFGFYAAETMFKTLLGFEFKFALGYGGSYDENARFNFRGDIMASYALFRWNKLMPGRVIFAPGFGYSFDGNLPSKYSNRSHVLLGGRIILYPSEQLDLRLTYDFALGGASQGVSIREHQFNVGANYTWFGASARLQLNRIAFDAVTVQDTVLGGALGIAF
jgi:hypothetical protein